MKKFLVVTGCPRSGTTLLMKLLNTHREFCIANEIDLMSVYGNMAKRSRRKFHKNLQISRKLSEREACLGNANNDYIPNPSIVIPKVLDAYASCAKPEGTSFEYLGDKYPRIYWDSKYIPLNSLAHEEFAEVTLIHVTRSPLEVINSICRRTANAKLGLDSWNAIESIEDAIYEWKLAWNSRKKLYAKTPFEMFIDLNYNALVHNPSDSVSKLAEILNVSNSFDHKIVSNAPIEWHIDKSQYSKITSHLPSELLCDDWHKFGLFLDKQSLIFKPKT